MARFWSTPCEEFGRAFDELFDELLIGRWRTVVHHAAHGQALVMDCGERYQVRMSTAGLDPREMEVDVGERRLTVRTRSAAGGVSERTFTFGEPVEREAVTARWSEGALVILLPKSKKRRRESPEGGRA